MREYPGDRKVEQRMPAVVRPRFKIGGAFQETLELGAPEAGHLRPLVAGAKDVVRAILTGQQALGQWAVGKNADAVRFTVGQDRVFDDVLARAVSLVSALATSSHRWLRGAVRSIPDTARCEGNSLTSKLPWYSPW